MMSMAASGADATFGVGGGDASILVEKAGLNPTMLDVGDGVLSVFDGGVELEHRTDINVSGAAKEAANIVSQSKEVQAFMHGQRERAEVGFDYDDGLITIYREDGEELSLYFHELNFDPSVADKREMTTRFIGVCESVDRAARDAGVIRGKNDHYYQGTAAAIKGDEIQSLPPSHGFNKFGAQVLGIGGMETAMVEGLNDCKSAEHAQCFMAGMRSAIVMMKEYASSFTMLELRYDGAISKKREEIQAAREGDAPAEAVAKLNRELTQLRKKKNDISAQKRKVANVDHFALYHTIWIQAKMKAEGMGGEAVAPSAAQMEKYRGQLESRILAKTGTRIRENKLYKMEFGEKEIPGSAQARKDYAKAVSGMVLTDPEQKAKNNSSRTLEELLFVEPSKYVMSEVMGSGTAPLGFPTGVFASLGEGIEAHLAHVHNHAQQEVMVEGGGGAPHFNFVGGASYHVVYKNGNVTLQNSTDSADVMAPAMAQGKMADIMCGNVVSEHFFNKTLANPLEGERPVESATHTLHRYHEANSTQNRKAANGYSDDACLAGEGDDVPPLLYPKPPARRPRSSSVGSASVASAATFATLDSNAGTRPLGGDADSEAGPLVAPLAPPRSTGATPPGSVSSDRRGPTAPRSAAPKRAPVVAPGTHLVTDTGMVLKKNTDRTGAMNLLKKPGDYFEYQGFNRETQTFTYEDKMAGYSLEMGTDGNFRRRVYRDVLERPDRIEEVCGHIERAGDFIQFQDGMLGELRDYTYDEKQADITIINGMWGLEKDDPFAY